MFAFPKNDHGNYNPNDTDQKPYSKTLFHEFPSLFRQDSLNNIPSLIRITRSDICRTSGSWVTIRRARSSSLARRRKIARISIPIWESRFAVGSSARMILLPPDKALAMATLCFSPPIAGLEGMKVDAQDPPPQGGFGPHARRPDLFCHEPVENREYYQGPKGTERGCNAGRRNRWTHFGPWSVHEDHPYRSNGPQSRERQRWEKEGNQQWREKWFSQTPKDLPK